MKTKIIIAVWVYIAHSSFAQNSSKITREFGAPIITDSASTFLIPVLYNTGIFTSDKLAGFGAYYSNVIFYNYKTDSSKKLFEKDVYIMNFDTQVYRSYMLGRQEEKNIIGKWFFYKVKNLDRNKNGRIDFEDPTILYVSDIYGKQLKALTDTDENLVSITFYEKQNIALIKMQRDANHDSDFSWKDDDYYYVKLDLSTLALGQKIEIK